MTSFSSFPASKCGTRKMVRADGTILETIERVYHFYTDNSNWERVNVYRLEGVGDLGDMMLEWECAGTGSMRGLRVLKTVDWDVFVEVIAPSPEPLPGEPSKTCIRIAHASGLNVQLLGEPGAPCQRHLEQRRRGLQRRQA